MRISYWSSDVCSSDLMSGKSGFVGRQIKTPIVKGQQVDALARHVGKEFYANARRLDQGHDLPDTAGYFMRVAPCALRPHFLQRLTHLSQHRFHPGDVIAIEHVEQIGDRKSVV